MAGNPDHNGKRPQPVEATDATRETHPDASTAMPFGIGHGAVDHVVRSRRSVLRLLCRSGR
jgi:hypothetical protein